MWKAYFTQKNGELELIVAVDSCADDSVLCRKDARELGAKLTASAQRGEIRGQSPTH